MHKGIKTPAYRQRIGYHAMLLGGIATITTAILVIGDLTTRDAIDARVAEDLRSLLAEVVPPELHDNNLLDDVMDLQVSDKSLFRTSSTKIYKAIHNKQVIAVAYEVFNQGYSGDIRVLIGIDRSGRILGVRVVSHTETPGLGDKIELQKSDWVTGFNGQSLGETEAGHWAVQKDGGVFDQFSGATITPRAVVSAVRNGLEFFERHKQSMFLLEAETKSDALVSK